VRSPVSDSATASRTASFDHIAAIVVTYHPAVEKLSALLDSIAKQVEWVIVVDNGSISQRDDLRALAKSHGCELVLLDKNVGLAAGHNLGISRAGERQPDAVLLLDQDSLPAPNMVSELRRALIELSQAGNRVAVVGPCQVDVRSGSQSPFIRFGYVRNDHLYCAGNGDGGQIRCDHLITSGSLIPSSALELIGEFDDRLFVDNVDTEWCFRAMSKGYELYGVCSAVMSHGVGDALIDTWVPHPRGVVVHSPMRLYYIIRNHMLLYRRPYTPARWTSQDLPRLLFKSVLFATSISPRTANVAMIWKGLRDGVRGKTGPYVV
jgi:rhamnosyltransferase